MIVAALEDARWEGPVNAVSPEPVRNEDLTRALGRALHRPTLFAVPAFAIRAALGEISGELVGSKRVTPRRAGELGFAFRFRSLSEALSAELSD